MELTPGFLLSIILGYFVVLIAFSYFTTRKATNEEFFTAGRRSPWFLVAFGMVGASLSGVTFISIPGVVGAGGANQAMSYMQIVIGYIIGYAVIANVLMPIYYKLGLVSI
jgi:Na+/proline symporter